MKKRVLLAGSIVAAALTIVGAISVSAEGPSQAPERELTIAGKKPAHFSHPTQYCRVALPTP